MVDRKVDIMRNNGRENVFWCLFSISLIFLTLGTTDAQPSAYFKASAPVSKSLPRIGRRSDLDTFPLPLPLSPPFANGQQQSEAGAGSQGSETHFWPENNYYQNEKQPRERSDSIPTISSSIPFLDLDHIAPSFWRNLLGEPEVSDRTHGGQNIGNIMTYDSNPTRNIYRSRSNK